MKDSKKSSLLGRLDKFQRLFFVALLSVLAVGAFAQSKTVSGTVLDKTGESVIGASVVVKGTTNGTITDFDGKFTLQNVPDNGTIQVSFVGYKTVDIQVKGQSTVKVILEEDTETLDEVVVVGYGVVKKSDVTGALTKVSEKQIKERPVQNLCRLCKVKLLVWILQQIADQVNWEMFEFVVIVLLLLIMIRYMLLMEYLWLPVYC